MEADSRRCIVKVSHDRVIEALTTEDNSYDTERSFSRGRRTARRTSRPSELALIERRS